MSEPLLIVCPSCHVPNRVPAERLKQRPSCGRCRQPLFGGQPLELGTGNFDSHFKRDGLPLLIDFWAPWCGPCRTMAPQFEHAAMELEPSVRLVKVDTEAEPALGQRFGVRSIPTLALFKDGCELARQAGAMTSTDIVRWTRQHLRG